MFVLGNNGVYVISMASFLIARETIAQELAAGVTESNAL